MFDWLYQTLSASAREMVEMARGKQPEQPMNDPNIAYLKNAIIVAKQTSANDLYDVCQQAARYAHEYQPVFLDYCGIVVECLPSMSALRVAQAYWDTVHGIELCRGR